MNFVIYFVIESRLSKADIFKMPHSDALVETATAEIYELQNLIASNYRTWESHSHVLR